MPRQRVRFAKLFLVALCAGLGGAVTSQIVLIPYGGPVLGVIAVLVVGGVAASLRWVSATCFVLVFYGACVIALSLEGLPSFPVVVVGIALTTLGAKYLGSMFARGHYAYLTSEQCTLDKERATGAERMARGRRPS